VTTTETGPATEIAAPCAEPEPLPHPGPEPEQVGGHQPTTLPGWRRFVAEVPTVPALLQADALAGLTPPARLAYDDLRLAHHASCSSSPHPPSARSPSRVGG